MTLHTFCDYFDSSSACSVLIPFEVFDKLITRNDYLVGKANTSGGDELSVYWDQCKPEAYSLWPILHECWFNPSSNSLALCDEEEFDSLNLCTLTLIFSFLGLLWFWCTLSKNELQEWRGFVLSPLYWCALVLLNKWVSLDSPPPCVRQLLNFHLWTLMNTDWSIDLKLFRHNRRNLSTSFPLPPPNHGKIVGSDWPNSPYGHWKRWCFLLRQIWHFLVVYLGGGCPIVEISWQVFSPADSYLFEDKWDSFGEKRDSFDDQSSGFQGSFMMLDCLPPKTNHVFDSWDAWLHWTVFFLRARRIWKPSVVVSDWRPVSTAPGLLIQSNIYLVHFRVQFVNQAV